MANKVRLKKYLRLGMLVSLLFLGLFLILNKVENKIQKLNYNQKVAQIISLVEAKYPMVSENEIMEMVNSKEINQEIFEKYNINLTRDSLILKNDAQTNIFVVINLSFLGVFGIILGLIFLRYQREQDKELKEITNYIEAINKRNYGLKMEEISEDELSILKNELYKITVMLKESADNSLKDKQNLKQALEDISHQLKTPLTSILIMLDNLTYEEVDKGIQEEFLRDIRREIVSINFLVQSLLKLTKFEVNQIKYQKEEILVEDLVREAVKKVAPIIDLKNINVKIEGTGKVKLVCDFKWQVEALTNILKNSLEHSQDKGQVKIKYEDCNAYVKIGIKDYGEGIKKEDLPHIFERFYKGSSNSDSMGIGLALAKSIIEEDKGTIEVTSNSLETEFVIKYFKI